MSYKRKINALSNIPRAPCAIDDLKDLPFKPLTPLPAKSFCMYIVGAPGSGKSNLWQAMLIGKKPVYYRGFFDHIELISGSLHTLSPKVTKQLPESQQHGALSDGLITTLVTAMQESTNNNNLLILDDVIKGISRSKVLSQIFLNRRHCTHDSSQESYGGLALMTTSQKYNLLPLEYRSAASDICLFKTSNASERKAIKEELMQDLSPEQQEDVLEAAWSEPYSFLYIKSNEPRTSRYYIKFDLIVFE